MRKACEAVQRGARPGISPRRQDTAEARHKELLAPPGVGGGTVNAFVYGPDLNNVEAELRALQQTAAEKNCPVNTTKAPGKPEPGMGPIH